MFLDKKIKKLIFKSLNLFFGIFVPKDTFSELLKKDNKTQSEYNLLVSHSSMVLSIGYSTLGFLIGIILYAAFLIGNNQFLADFSLWFFVGIGFSLGSVGAIKYLFIKNFQTVHGLNEVLPNKYVYGMCDLDIVISLVGGILIGFLATVISTPII